MTASDAIARCVAVEAISFTLSRYCRYVDAGDSLQLSALFHLGSEYRPMEGRKTYGGPSGVQQFFAELQSEFITLFNAGGSHPPRLTHHLAQPDIQTLSPSLANVVTRFSVYSDIGLDHTECYHDVLTPTSSGSWLFSSREILLDWVDGKSSVNALLAADD